MFYQIQFLEIYINTLDMFIKFLWKTHIMCHFDHIFGPFRPSSKSRKSITIDLGTIYPFWTFIEHYDLFIHSPIYENYNSTNIYIKFIISNHEFIISNIQFLYITKHYHTHKIFIFCHPQRSLKILYILLYWYECLQLHTILFFVATNHKTLYHNFNTFAIVSFCSTRRDNIYVYFSYDSKL